MHARQCWIGRGGAFTDIVARMPERKLLTHKLLSDHPDQYRGAATAGMRRLLKVQNGKPIPSQETAQ